MTTKKKWEKRNLSPKLLHNLEQHYTQVALMWQEGLPLEDAASNIRVSYEDLEDMHLVMLNPYPTYTIDNIFGGRVNYKFNSHSLQSTIISQDIEDGDRI
jgi:hypothetical protein